jgi:hypothetical protein
MSNGVFLKNGTSYPFAQLLVTDAAGEQVFNETRVRFSCLPLLLEVVDGVLTLVCFASSTTSLDWHTLARSTLGCVSSRTAAHQRSS